MTNAVWVVPCHARTAREARWVERLSASAFQQTAPPAALLLVDDGSPVLIPRVPGTRIIRSDRRSGPAHARNVGVAAALDAGAEVVLFTDLDCVPAPDWTQVMTDELARGPYHALGGRTFALGKTLLDRFHDVNGTLNGRLLAGRPRDLLYACTCNMAVTRDVAARVPFDPSFPDAAGEDVDFSLRLARRFRLGLCPDAVVRHDFGYRTSLLGLRRLVTTFRKYAGGNAILRERHPGYLAAAWFGSIPVPSEMTTEFPMAAAAAPAGPRAEPSADPLNGAPVACPTSSC